MLSDGLKWLRLDDPQQGEVLLLVPLPVGDDPWGSLAPLRGTVWGDQVREVSGAVLSDALHGWATGLMRVIGPEPRYLQQRIPEAAGRCTHYGGCALSAIHCRPGPKMPDCYEAPHESKAISRLASTLARAWRDGRYVIVVVGPEWSLR